MKYFVFAFAIAVMAQPQLPKEAPKESIQALGYRWDVQSAGDWAIEKEGGVEILRLRKRGEPTVPRRPTKFAIADTGPFKKVTVELEMRRQGGKSLMIVYGWQDPNHWNYAHVSGDEGKQVNVHNGMFHVFGGERVRISSLEGPNSLPTEEWTPVKLVFDGETGRCYVEVKGKRNPSLEAVDLSLRWGKIGLGSFNETGDFRNLKITGTPR